jgi:hypothetical protein
MDQGWRIGRTRCCVAVAAYAMIVACGTGAHNASAAVAGSGGVGAPGAAQQAMGAPLGVSGSAGAADVTSAAFGGSGRGGAAAHSGAAARTAMASPGGAGIAGANQSAANGGSHGAANGGSGAAGADRKGDCSVSAGSQIGLFNDPIKTTNIAPPDPPGITFNDSDGNPVNAHGGGVIRECDTFYLHGEYFLSTTTDNNFNGFSMYSSRDLATWKNEGIILPQQPSGQLGPNRKGERPHIIKCPRTSEFVLYAHAADTTYQADKQVVYATSQTVNGKYAFKGSLTNANGTIAAHSDMSALTDGSEAYVVTESGWVYTLAKDCHTWLSAKQSGAVNGMTGGIEAPTVWKAGATYYWIGSDKTGWRANDDFYSTAPAMTGPWTYRGYLAPAGKLTWMSQSTWVIPVAGSEGTSYVYWGDHWYGNQDTSAPGKHNHLATYVFQPVVFNGTEISLPSYQVSWRLDVGAGTWSP